MVLLLQQHLIRRNTINNRTSNYYSYNTSTRSLLVWFIASISTGSTSATATTTIITSEARNNNTITTNTRSFLRSYASLINKQRSFTTTVDNTKYDYDYLIIGGGSGGIASARRAASHNKDLKIAIIESNMIGGTCINVGCVPKKILWNAASIGEKILHDDLIQYGFDNTENITFDWNYLKTARDKYIQKLNLIYQRNLLSSNVTYLHGIASFIKQQQNNSDENTPYNTILFNPANYSTNTNSTNNINTNIINNSTNITKEQQQQQTPYTITAKHILIATGGKPNIPNNIDGINYAITSDEFFNDLHYMPQNVVIVGGGYIAVELCSLLHSLGCPNTNLVLRYDKPLRKFDEMLSTTLLNEFYKQGINIYTNTNGIKKIVLQENYENDNNNIQFKTVYLHSGEIIHNVDTVIIASGREPNVDKLNLSNIGIKQDNDGYIIVNEYSQTSINKIYAVGDVVDSHIELTPSAIAFGRRLADRLFSNDEKLKNIKASYDLVPTVIFTHPPIGTIGLTEQQAIDKYGKDYIKIYKSQFVNLYYGPFINIESNEKPKTVMKLICLLPTEQIIGLHVIGMNADEMLQGFAVAIKMGATKYDFDATTAIHPTAAEEFVTMYPWGLSPPSPISG